MITRINLTMFTAITGITYDRRELSTAEKRS